MGKVQKVCQAQNRRSKWKRTNPTSWASKYYGNDEFAEMVESKVISEMIRDKYILVNKIASPGLKRYKQANDVTKNQQTKQLKI